MGDNQSKDALDTIRNEIDEVDAEIVMLVARRAQLAQSIGAIKSDKRQPYFTPEREHQILDRISKIDAVPLRPDHLVAIFREIISAARSAEKPLSIAFWGPEGTYSHIAAIQAFGRSAEFAPADSISEVFLAVEQHRASYGVVPIENSTAGVVPETLEMFPKTNVRICAEAFVSVRHCLASGGADLGSVKRVYAGPQPAAQCKNWLQTHLPKAETVNVAPTVRAAQSALADPEGAAIVNSVTVEALSMTLLAENLQDNPNNKTRFVVLGFNEPSPTGHDKTTILFHLRNKPGELYRALGAFVENGVNLTMIESLPAQRSTLAYMFYVDCAGHRSEPAVSQAVQAIESFALASTVLGSYPSNDPNLTTNSQ